MKKDEGDWHRFQICCNFIANMESIPKINAVKIAARELIQPAQQKTDFLFLKDEISGLELEFIEIIQQIIFYQAEAGQNKIYSALLSDPIKSWSVIRDKPSPFFCGLQWKINIKVFDDFIPGSWCIWGIIPATFIPLCG